MGGKSCCYQFLRLLVFLNNFLYWLLGLGFVAVSIWLLFDEQLYGQTLESKKADYFTGTYILLVLGALIATIRFLGCCGSWKESACMLGTFNAFLMIIFVAEICCGVFIYFQKDSISSIIEKSIDETVMKKYDQNVSAASMATFDKIQQELECCG